MKSGWINGSTPGASPPCSALSRIAFLVALLASAASTAHAASPVKAWGQSTDGKTSVPDSVTNVVGISAGSFHSLAVRADGTVVGWGQGLFNETTPPSNATNVVAVAAGNRFSLALRGDGSVVGWGINTWGQRTIPSAATNVVAIAAGHDHSVALRRDGTVITWGRFEWYPTQETNVVAIAAGLDYTAILRADGTVRVWSGFWPNNDHATPTDATNLVSVSTRYVHTLGLRRDGSVLAWGFSTAGNTLVPETLPPAKAVAAGDSHSLALLNDGTVVGWGSNTYGQVTGATNVSQGLDIRSGAFFSIALEPEPGSPISPRIGRHPESRTVQAGHLLSLNSLALGSLPLHYQWLRNGEPISEQTNAWLADANVQPDEAGSYQLIVTNHYGAITSGVAVVHITVPRPSILSPRIDANGFSFQFHGFRSIDYRIECRDESESDDWIELEQRIGEDSLMTVIDPAYSTSPSRLYRVRLTP